MKQSTSIAPPNSLLCVSDPKGGIVPDFIPDKLILSTPSFITVGCLPFMDGETTVIIGSAHDVDPGKQPMFDGFLDTSNRSVVVSTVEQEEILREHVSTTRTRVRIWPNDPRWPDEVIIGLE